MKREAAARARVRAPPVAFTPKGGCPLKPGKPRAFAGTVERSIHPQGWVPIETLRRRNQ